MGSDRPAAGRQNHVMAGPMTMENIIAILKNIRPECEFGPVDDFFARGMLDSFDLTMLVSALEERFSISMDGSDILPENFRSVEAILSLLARYGVANGVSF
jgi:acyl carrier protein